MIITCIQSVLITYADNDGVKRVLATRPGSHNYPQLDHKDPLVAEQLRVYRKHHKIGFDEILESDKPVLAAMDPKIQGKERARAFIKEVTIKPSPVGKIVKGKKKNATDSKPHKKAHAKSVDTGSKTDTGKSEGAIPGQKENAGS